jgi:hypothetical protein
MKKHTKIKALFIALVFGMALTATIPVKAQTTVTGVTPGGLAAAVHTEIGASAELSTVTNLIVSGTIDARDFRFIRDSLNSSLVSLDLSGCTIDTYTGTGGPAFTTTGANLNKRYGQDTVPATAFYSRKNTGTQIRPNYIETKMTQLTSVILPAGTKVIDQQAFQGAAITSIDLSSLTSLTDINYQAFYQTALQKVKLPSSLTYLNKAFAATKIDTIRIPASVTGIAAVNNFFEGCKNLKAVIFEETCQLTTLPGRMFAGPNGAGLDPDSLLYVMLPSSVTDVQNTFEGFMGNYIDVHASNTVYISVGGVLYKKGVPSAPDTIVAVPKGLASFTIPADMTVIPDELCQNMTNLTNLTVLSQLTEIGNNAFENCPITSFDFPSTLVRIGSQAFKGTKLTNVELKNNALLTKLGDGVFREISTLETADISGLSFAGNSMFSNSNSLATVTLGSNLTKIGTQAFVGTALTSIQIPNTVDSIMAQAFGDVSTLTAINIPASLMFLGGYAFGGTGIEGNLTLPASFKAFQIANYLGNAFAKTHVNLNVDANNPYFTSQNGMLFNKAKDTLYYLPNSKTEANIIIPEGVTTVAQYSFNANANAMVKELTMPSTLKYVYSYGLQGVNNIETLTVNAVIPPVLASNNSLGEGTYKIRKIIIPTGTKAAYLSADGWKKYPDSLYVMDSKFTDFGEGRSQAVSPNGKYIGGIYMGKGFIYNVETGVRTIIDSCTEVIDVNDNGHAAVIFYDTNFYYKFENYDVEPMRVDSMPLLNGGAYRNGKLYSLGLGRYGFLPEGDNAPVTNIQSIDEDGNIYGSTDGYNDLSKVFAFVWKYNSTNDDYTTDTAAAFSSPQTSEDQGACIFSVSKDGQTAGGWLARDIYGGGRNAIIWPRPDTFLIPNENDNQSVGGARVSPNGKYSVFTYNGKAAIYDIDNNKLDVFGPDKSHTTAVSSNGFVVGYQNNSQGGRTAFIWSEKLGYKTFREFFDEYLPEMSIPDENEFFQFTGLFWDVPEDISEDGLTITGWSGHSASVANGWLIQIPNALDLIDRPHNLTATIDIPKRKAVNLSWTEPEGSSHSLDFYYIYRNGQYLGRVDAAAAGTNYTDTNAPSGLVSYQVSVAYDYENSTTYLESSLSDPAEVTIIDNYNLPFTENFEANDLSYNYWTAEGSPTSAWLIYGGHINGTRDAIFLGAGNGLKYNFSLTSKPFDATSKEKVILAFTHAVLSYAEEFFGIPDTVSIEVGMDDEWTTVKQIIVNGVFDWTPATIDISEAAANKLFRVRFRASSGSNKIEFNYVLDNLGIGFENAATPAGVIAYRINEADAPVRVLYKDGTGSYGLSYGTGTTNATFAGNNGNSIIAANKFTYNELVKMRGKYLTSVSAYLFPDFPRTVIPSVLKLAVFVNGERVENSTIEEWEGYTWNNFPLSEPIAITDQINNIYVGIEAASGDEYNMPLSMGIEPFDEATESFLINPNGNLYSEDGGITWENANPDNSFMGHWDIVANIRDENHALTPDDDINAVRYEIYRNGTLVNPLHYGQIYMDETGSSDDDCYTVKVFTMLGGLSAISQEGCIEVLEPVSISSNITIEKEKVSVYPNPTTAIITISTDVKAVRVYNMQGKVVARANTSKVDMRALPEGTYLIEILTAKGNTATTKVIKK